MAHTKQSKLKQFKFKNLRIRTKFFLSYLLTFILCFISGLLVIWPIVKNEIESNIDQKLSDFNVAILSVIERTINNPTRFSINTINF